MLSILKLLLEYPVVQKFIRNKFVYKLMETKLFNWLLNDIIPKLRLSNQYTKMNGADFKEIYRLARPGDILLSVDTRNLTTAIIGGEYAHAGLIMCESEMRKGILEVSEMVAEGYHETYISDFCYHADYVALLRVDDPRWTPEYIKEVIKVVKSFEGHGYNRQFMPHVKPDKYWKNKKGDKVYQFHYCSQMITDADVDDVIDANWEDLMGLGIPYISPTGLKKAKNVKVIYEMKKPRNGVGKEK